MADTKWTIKGREFVNCNCSYGCPCLERAYVDKGYRGHDASNPRRVFISGQKRGSSAASSASSRGAPPSRR